MKPKHLTSRGHILSVDVARGIFAFSVMLYHLFAFEGIAYIERVANFAVYGFFAISGFAMYVAYRDRLGSPAEVVAYLAHRFFRIAPLFYVALLLRLILSRFDLPEDGLYALYFNVTLLFGFANPGASLVPGGWSIGIEIVFYVLFPIVMFATRGRLRALAIVAGLLTISQLVFVNHTLVGKASLELAMAAYLRPIAFIGYFAVGCLLGAVFQRWPTLKGNWTSWLLLVVGLLPFLFVDDQDTIGMIAGPMGALLFAATILVVAGAAFIPEPTSWMRPIAKFVGDVSYPVYLLHNLMYGIVGRLGIPTSPLRIVATIALTLAAAVVIRRLIEIPVRNFGRGLTFAGDAQGGAVR